MIISNQYVYLVTTLVGLIPAIIFFFTHKKYRFDMIWVGLVIAFASLFTAWIFWTKDWWFPETITGASFGVEDFLLGFNTGSIAVIVNTLLFPIPRSLIEDKKNWSIVPTTVLIFLVSMFACFFVFGFGSFISFVVSGLLSIFWIFLRTKVNPFKTFTYAVTYSLISLWPYFFHTHY